MLKGQLVGLLTVACLGASNAAAEPYSFQNIPLGIDLESFRGLKPQTTTSIVTGESMKETKVFCSGDKLPHLDIPLPEQEALNVQASERICEFFGRNDPSYEDWSQLSTNFANAKGGWAIFHFIDDPHQSKLYRLFRIDVLAENGNYLDVFMAYAAKFKKPTHAETTPVTNGLGQSFDNHTATWANAESSVTLTQRAGRIDYMSVEYVYTLLERHFNEKLAVARKSGADSL